MEGAMRQEAQRQRQLFEDQKEIQPQELQQEVQRQATRLLTQWMEALASSIRAEVDNEQD
jgi:biotin-(acetyl-CoA carboxylase) ligase